MKTYMNPRNKYNKRYAKLYGERDIIFWKGIKGNI